MSTVTEIILPAPLLGSKAFLLEAKGIYVLERGPGLLRTIACTHAGCGSMVAVDGYPDDNGFFPEVDYDISDLPTDPKRGGYFGRPFYRANPVVMGSWMLDAAFFHGLTLVHTGGNDDVSAIASIVWMPYRARVVPAAPIPEVKPEAKAAPTRKAA